MQQRSWCVAALVVVAVLTLFGLGCGQGEPQQQAESLPEGETGGHQPAEAEQPASEPAGDDMPAEAPEDDPAPATEADQPEWKSMKQQAKAEKIDEMADEALEQLFVEHPKAKELYAKSHGWAAFDNLKVAFGVSGGGGNGVAVNKQTGERTYMKMGTGGVGLGLGANKYQVVFLFQDATTFGNFVDKGWQADAGATASAGKSAAEVKTDFVNGLAIYQLTEKGLMASADIAGTKYWKNKKLNN